jgi:hypothetical protein
MAQGHRLSLLTATWAQHRCLGSPGLDITSAHDSKRFKVLTRRGSAKVPDRLWFSLGELAVLQRRMGAQKRRGRGSFLGRFGIAPPASLTGGYHAATTALRVSRTAVERVGEALAVLQQRAWLRGRYAAADAGRRGSKQQRTTCMRRGTRTHPGLLPGFASELTHQPSARLIWPWLMACGRWRRHGNYRPPPIVEVAFPGAAVPEVPDLFLPARSPTNLRNAANRREMADFAGAKDHLTSVETRQAPPAIAVPSCSLWRAGRMGWRLGGGRRPGSVMTASSQAVAFRCNFLLAVVTLVLRPRGRNQTSGYANQIKSNMPLLAEERSLFASTVAELEQRLLPGLRYQRERTSPASCGCQRRHCAGQSPLDGYLASTGPVPGRPWGAVSFGCAARSRPRRPPILTTKIRRPSHHPFSLWCCLPASLLLRPLAPRREPPGPLALPSSVVIPLLASS